MTIREVWKVNWPAILVLIAYLLVGTLYAIYTPLWQAPDEPAHYNYVRSLAAGGGFPVMQPGDYDQAYLSRLTTEGFPPELSIEPLAYEGHQPPLYYVLAVPCYWLFQGSVRALRLFSLMIGGVGVVVIFAILREVRPTEPGIAWFGGGLVALIPQYLSIMASVNNDAMVLALFWLWLWLALRYLRGQASPWVLGGVAGAVLLTKATGYHVLPLMLLIVYLRYRRTGMSWGWMARQLVALLLPALLLGGVWWIRNVTVYGWPDVMGLQRHDLVVQGQLRTSELIAELGMAGFLRSASWTTFRSFWGQFGWMGVVLDLRIYQGLLIFSTLSFAGALWRLVDLVQRGTDVRQRDALILLGSAALITVTMYVGYNVVYVQHQGRYLFSALPFVGLAIALGWQQLLHRELAVGMSFVLLLAIVVVGVWGLLSDGPPLWPMAMMGGAAVGLPVLAYASMRWRAVAIAGALVGMVALDLWCLFGFIVPMLAS